LTESLSGLARYAAVSVVMHYALFVLGLLVLAFRSLTRRYFRARKFSRSCLRKRVQYRGNPSSSSSADSQTCSNNSALCTVAILHPDALGGGGGERVLWLFVRALRQRYSPETVRIEIFCRGVAAACSRSTVATRLEEQFGLKLRTELDHIHLRALWFAPLLDASNYPVLTLLLQFMAGAVVGMEIALLRNNTPDVLVDMTGHSGSLPVARWLAGCHTAAYVHYPTISTDMLRVVRERRAQFNNNARIAASPVLSLLKLAYYRAFSVLYAAAGACADVVIANSTWTRRHLEYLWPSSRANMRTIFPPVDTAALRTLPLEPREPALIVSLAQFRAEKNHLMQLRAFSLLTSSRSSNTSSTSSSPSSSAASPVVSTLAPELKADARLVLIGGCRNEDDAARVHFLSDVAVNELGLRVPQQVEFVVNANRRAVLALLARASAGIHTMKDEHFGISVVELQAAGLLTVAHNSGGVKADIITDCVDGWLASSEQQYAHILARILQMPHAERAEKQQNARTSAHRFSDEAFEQSILHAIEPLLPHE